MAQLFTLDFNFRHSLHSALITVRSIGGDQQVSVHFNDDRLDDIVPEGELSFRLSNTGRTPLRSLRPGYNELEQVLRAEVTRHLRASRYSASDR